MAKLMVFSYAYLLTGEPGVGKSTLVKRLVEALGHRRCGGFYTEEIQENGRRTGFRLVTLDGRSEVLAHEHMESPVRHGRYGIDLACLDILGVPALTEAATQGQLTILDEIGPIEARSALFRQTVLTVLDSATPVVGTVALKPHPWIDAIKQHPRAKTRVLTAENRDQVFQDLLVCVRQAL